MKTVWDLEKIYINDSAWEERFKEISNIDLPTRLDGVEATLDRYIAVIREIDKLYTYAHLKRDENVADPKAKERYDRITLFYHEVAHKMAWLEPALMETEETCPKYAFYLQKIRDQKAHILSREKEELMALAGQMQGSPQRVFSLFNNADIKFPDVCGKPLTHALYHKYMKDKDRELREASFKAMHGAYHAFENTVTELLVGQVETHRFTQKARGYKSCLEAALHQNHIPTSVYHALIQAVKENQKVLHDYVAMRKERLGVKELHYWDLSVPLVEDSDRTFSYEEAVDIVIQSVAPLGKEYQSIVEKGLRKDGWVDVYEKKGKRSGAYSSGSYDTMPYILLNYQGTISDVMTLSHEVGHSMHSYLSRQGQSYHNAQYPIFLAEIASTFHERLTYTYMMQNEKDREFLIYQQIEGIRSTFFRQAMFAEFELKIHEEGPMTAHKLKEIYLQLNREYFGPALTLDDVLGCEYLRIPHFYYNFYVYQYATGIAAAYALGDIVEKEGPDRYLRFLQSGGSAYPIDILKEAGVDITSKEALSGIIGFWKNLLAKNRTGK